MKPAARGLLRKGASELGVALSEGKLNQFEIYLDQLKQWNQRVNLIGPASEQEIVVRHFLDSLSCIGSGVIRDNSRVIDLGSGAGFPGLPLKIALPSIKLILVDSIRKKTQFMEEIVRFLELEDVEVVWDRAEDIGRQATFREKFDLALARAIARLPVLMEYSLPLVKIGGYFVAQKGDVEAEEKDNGQRAARVLGGEVKQFKQVKVPFMEAERQLVLTRKKTLTPLKYPRRAGIPEKRPLGSK